MLSQLRAPLAHVHLPALHELPGAHGVPQAPQFSLSASSATHVVPQSVSPVPQPEAPALPALLMLPALPLAPAVPPAPAVAMPPLPALELPPLAFALPALPALPALFPSPALPLDGPPACPAPPALSGALPAFRPSCAWQPGAEITSACASTNAGQKRNQECVEKAIIHLRIEVTKGRREHARGQPSRTTFASFEPPARSIFDARISNMQRRCGGQARRWYFHAPS